MSIFLMPSIEQMYLAGRVLCSCVSFQHETLPIALKLSFFRQLLDLFS